VPTRWPTSVFKQADDENSIVDLVIRRLKRMVLHANCAKDGTTALSMLKGADYDLIPGVGQTERCDLSQAPKANGDGANASFPVVRLHPDGSPDDQTCPYLPSLVPITGFLDSTG